MLCDFPPTRNATKEQGKKEGAPAKPIEIYLTAVHSGTRESRWSCKVIRVLWRHMHKSRILTLSCMYVPGAIFWLK